MSALPVFMTLALLVVQPALGTAAAPEIHGQVVTVRSCDQVVVRAKGKLVVIRVAGIECPAPAQRFGPESRAFVARHVAGQTITVKPLGQDRRRRVWGDVFLPDGRSLAYEMVKAGWARISASLIDARLSELEDEARRGKRGLWDESPAAPPKASEGRTQRGVE
ncbi:thermonuclease family protein [Candidatus Nitrospira bockiana]